MENPWKVLGLDPTTSEADIKSAFRKKALKCHPDVRPNDPDVAQKEFIELGQAYEQCLADAPYVLKEQPKGPTVSGFTSNDYRYYTPKAPPGKPGETTIYVILSDKQYDPATKRWAGTKWVSPAFAKTGGVMFCLLGTEEFKMRVPPLSGAMWYDIAVQLKSGIFIQMRVGIEEHNSKLTEAQKRMLDGWQKGPTPVWKYDSNSGRL